MVLLKNEYLANVKRLKQNATNGNRMLSVFSIFRFFKKFNIIQKI